MIDAIAVLTLILIAVLGALGASGGLALGLLLGIALMLFGLPHGAIDVSIAGLFRRGVSTRRRVAYVFGYLALAVLCFGLWQLLPFATLLGFLFLSAWHFGTGDYDHLGQRPSGRLGPLRMLGQGSIPLICVMAAAPAEAALAMSALLQPESVRFMGWYEVLWFSLLGIGGLGAAIDRIQLCLEGRVSIALRWTLIDFALILAAIWAGPVPAFLGWFCSAHALRHFQLHRALIGGSPRRIPWRMLTVIALLTFASVAFVAGLFAGQAIESHLAPSDRLLRLLFIGLATLTIPHIITLEWARRYPLPLLPRARE